jgi:hypothetical protein
VVNGDNCAQRAVFVYVCVQSRYGSFISYVSSAPDMVVTSGCPVLLLHMARFGTTTTGHTYV